MLYNLLLCCKGMILYFIMIGDMIQKVCKKVQIIICDWLT